jgi:hypothetical protein
MVADIAGQGLDWPMVADIERTGLDAGAESDRLEDRRPSGTIEYRAVATGIPTLIWYSVVELRLGKVSYA